MTKQECAVIQAYTGTTMLQGDDLEIFYSYIEHLMGRPVFTHEIPDLEPMISRLSKKDFLMICETAVDLDDIIDGLEEFFADSEDPNVFSDENVDHPAHYQTDDGIETIDVIEAFTKGLEGIEAVCTGNILKYVCRWKKKNGVEDLKKAQWYLDKLIESLH